MIWIGIAIGWVTLGVFDYLVARNAAKRAYDRGFESAMKQVSSW